MKSFAKALVVAALISAPLAAFAQNNQSVTQPVTRAQVREELVRLHNVGYSPLDDRNSYPVHIQAAEARLAGQESGYGEVSSGSSQAGARSVGVAFSHH